MLLPDFILDALPDDNASGIRIFCDDKEKQKEIADFFKKTFEENWEEAKRCFEDEIGIEPDEICVDILSAPEFSDNSIFFRVLPLDMQANDGARSYSEFGCDAFDNTVKALEKKYPGILYEGCIQYAWCDEHCGDTTAYELHEEDSDKIYDFVGKILNEAVEDGMMFDDLEWMYEPEENEAEFRKIAEDYKKYLSKENYDRIIAFIER